MSSSVSVAPQVGDVRVAIDRHLQSLPVADQLTFLESVRAHVDARESTLLAARLRAGASARSVESLLQRDDKVSKRSAKQRTRRAKAVEANPDLAVQMESGDLSVDQADVIAAAAEKSNGAAAEDEALIERVSATPPDQARKIADEWVRKHTTAQQVQDRHDRQRRLRCVQRWVTDRGTHMLALEGDEESIDRIELTLKTRSMELYREDGGRDLPAGRHPRTRDQRMFDAAVELLTGDSDGSKAGSRRTGNPRSAVVVTMTAEQATGVDPSPIRQVGGGLLAPSVLEEMFCGAELVGQVVDRTGSPLWLGRSTRYFSKQQVLAMIVRDGGCVRCGAHYSQCDAHHVIPWESPARGPTDIDNGALLCSDCHHVVHEHNLILLRDPDSGTWSTRPARPQEVAPRRRPDQQPERRAPSLHERRRSGSLR